MNRYERILTHPIFIHAMQRIDALEATRLHCKHGIAHLLDVCRIAYLMALEEQLPYSKDLIYTTGLLHDVGKFQQYEDGTPHHKASAALAADVLQDIGYPAAEQTLILSAILHHRKASAAENAFDALLYRADKASRICFLCAAQTSCNWDADKKTKTLRF